MTDISALIEKALHQAIEKEFETRVEAPLKLQTPPDPNLGDFAFPCFPLAKALRMGPPVIAARLKPHLEQGELFEKVEAAGPYLNLTVDKPYFARTVVNAVLDDPERFGRSEIGQGVKVLIEYSAPNTNKPLHLGHVRNNALGISLTHMLGAVGYEVTPVNLVNDRGVHICKSMLAYDRFGEGKNPQSEGRKGDHFVGDWYVRYDQEERAEFEASGMEDKDAFIAQSKLYGEVQEMLVKWEQGDPEIRALWEKMNAWVYAGFDETYKRMGCRFDRFYYESETYRLGKELVQQGLDKGVFFKKDDGSVWVDLTDMKLDEKLLLRADGTSVYITQDLGTTKLKFDDFKMDRAVWIVGDEQIYHFNVLFAALKKLGFDWADGCFHLPYGMVDLPEGKMKSREGTVVDADDLMDELFEMEKEEIKSRDLPIEGADLDRTAEILAQGALKFFILKFLPRTRMTFNPKESISPEGFTGPYVQYAYVRIQSIFRKAGGEPALDVETAGRLTRPEEIAVIRRLHDFPGEVRIAAEGYNPSRLCTYLFELAREYNRFYHNLPVLAADEEGDRNARLLLSRATAHVLRQGLSLLGIEVPERM